ncbi:MAG: ABC transporter permease [Actinobacteria bacterium]|nr:ABC transporter permease [Actinomycetota bacterium]
MVRFLLRRFVGYAVLVVIAACLGYLLAASSLDPRSNFEGRNPPPPPESVDRVLSDLNLNDDEPVLERFGTWVGGVLRGDFGRTIGGEPVIDEMGRRMGVSLRLLLLASVLGGVLGVLVGTVGAVRQYRFSDHATTLLSFLTLATPVFLLAVLLKLAALQLNRVAGRTIVYYTGEATPGLQGAWWQIALDRVQHLLLPTLAIVLAQAAFYSRYQRNAMLDVLGSDFLRTAQAKGLRRRQALLRHGLRTALIPMSTFFAYQFGLLLTGATFIEKIFGWHGMGEWFVDSVNGNDVNVVAAVTVFAAALVLVAGMLADLAHAVLDPRVRIR